MKYTGAGLSPEQAIERAREEARANSSNGSDFIPFSFQIPVAVCAVRVAADFNLQAVFNGHYHSLTERKHRDVLITTNRCCALKRTNHDGTKQKGYFVCEARDGRMERTFVEYKAT